MIDSRYAGPSICGTFTIRQKLRRQDYHTPVSGETSEP
jgi:hypothetical protein